MEKDFKKSLILILGFAGFIVMADNWVVSPILPAIAKDINVDIARAGLLISSYMIPFGLFQILFGPLADRYGKKNIITFSIVMFTIATGLCALGSSLTNLAIFRALTGVFAASVMPISLALIGDVFPIEERQSAIGSFMGISFLGQGMSMAIGGAIAYFISWRQVFVVYAILSVIPALLILKNYKNMPSIKNPDSQFLKPYFMLLSNFKSLITYFVVLLEGMFIVGGFSYIGSFIAKEYNYNNLLIGLIMTAFGVMSLIGGRISGNVAKKIGIRKILVIGLLSAALGELLIYNLGYNLIILIVSIGLMGLGFIFTHSTLLTRATEFAKKERGAAMSLVAFCFMGGGGVGTAIGSRIVQSMGLNSIFLFYGVMLIITTIIAYFTIKEI